MKKKIQTRRKQSTRTVPSPLGMAFVQTLIRQPERSVAAASEALGLTEAQGRCISVKSRVKKYMCIYSEHYARFLVEHMVDETFREVDKMLEKTPERMRNFFMYGTFDLPPAKQIEGDGRSDALTKGGERIRPRTSTVSIPAHLR